MRPELRAEPRASRAKSEWQPERPRRNPQIETEHRGTQDKGCCHEDDADHSQCTALSECWFALSPGGFPRTRRDETHCRRRRIDVGIKFESCRSEHPDHCDGPGPQERLWRTECCLSAPAG